MVDISPVKKKKTKVFDQKSKETSKKTKLKKLKATLEFDINEPTEEENVEEIEVEWDPKNGRKETIYGLINQTKKENKEL